MRFMNYCTMWGRSPWVEHHEYKTAKFTHIAGDMGTKMPFCVHVSPDVHKKPPFPVRVPPHMHKKVPFCFYI